MARKTRQRDVIGQVIRDAGRPLSAREMLTEGRRRLDGLGMATVYRTIRLMVAEGRLAPVEIPGQTTRYEPAGLRHHHHFYCRICRRVFELQGCPLLPKIRTPRGYDVEGHEVTLFGRCPACQG